MNRVEAFIELQLNANQELDSLGTVSEHTANELEKLADSLNPHEVVQALELYDRLIDNATK